MWCDDKHKPTFGTESSPCLLTTLDMVNLIILNLTKYTSLIHPLRKLLQSQREMRRKAYHNTCIKVYASLWSLYGCVVQELKDLGIVIPIRLGSYYLYWSLG